MEYNVIYNGIKAKAHKKNRAAIIRNILKTDIEMTPETADRLQISKIFRMGEIDNRRIYPRPVCIQFAYRNHKDLIMSGVKMLKAKKSPFRFAYIAANRTSKRKKETIL